MARSSKTTEAQTEIINYVSVLLGKRPEYREHTKAGLSCKWVTRGKWVPTIALFAKTWQGVLATDQLAKAANQHSYKVSASRGLRSSPYHGLRLTIAPDAAMGSDISDHFPFQMELMQAKLVSPRSLFMALGAYADWCDSEDTPDDKMTGTDLVPLLRDLASAVCIDDSGKLNLGAPPISTGQLKNSLPVETRAVTRTLEISRLLTALRDYQRTESLITEEIAQNMGRLEQNLEEERRIRERQRT